MSSILPGVQVRVSQDEVPAGDTASQGRLHVVGVTERGPTVPTVVSGLGGFVRTYGRAAWDTLTLALSAFWQASEGAGDVTVSRVVGPAAVVASKTVSDGTANTIEFEASWPGAAGNDIDVIVAADGDGFQVTVTYDGDPVERWRGLANVDDAVQTLQASDWIRAVNDPAGTGNPSVGTYSLEGGDDDRANITDAQWEAALDAIGVAYGPGQVVAPGRTSADGRGQLVDHAEAHNRVALLDLEEGSSKAQLLTAAGAADSRHAALVGPPVQVRLDGRIRTVPASVVAAGVCARIDVDAPTGHTGPDRGRAGLSSRFVSVSDLFDDADAAELNGGGVSLFRPVGGQVLLRGFRTTSGEPGWEQLSQARYVAGLVWRLERIAEDYVFAPLTRATVADFGAELAGVLLADAQAGALFGDDPYTVDVGQDVNPDGQLADGVLKARVEIVPTATAERIILDLRKTRS